MFEIITSPIYSRALLKILSKNTNLPVCAGISKKFPPTEQH